MAARSYLLVPGSSAATLAIGAVAGARRAGADALIVDLAGTGQLDGWRPGGTQLWVRLAAGDQGHAEIRSVVAPTLAGVCVAGASSAAAIAALGAELAAVEEAMGMPLGSVAIAPVLDSAAGVLNAAEIARAPRVARLHLDETDLVAELGVEPGPDERELLWVRSQIVLASAAARIAAPVGSAGGHDLAALRASSSGLRRLGFGARVCLDPAQLAVVHEIFGAGRRS
jgi:citrate lyase subunit beta/citryl-CoA lyase